MDTRTHLDSRSYEHVHPNTIPDAATDPNPDADRDVHTDPYSRSDTNSDGDPHADANPDPHADGNTNSHADAAPHADADAGGDVQSRAFECRESGHRNGLRVRGYCPAGKRRFCHRRYEPPCN